MDDAKVDDMSADERAYGWPRGSIREINDACEAFFRRRGMPSAGSYFGRHGRRAQPPQKPEQTPATLTIQTTSTATIMKPTEPEPSEQSSPTPTDPEAVSDNEIFILIDLALAGNALVKSALENEGKRSLTNTVRKLRKVLTTAREAGLIDPD